MSNSTRTRVDIDNDILLKLILIFGLAHAFIFGMAPHAQPNKIRHACAAVCASPLEHRNSSLFGQQHTIRAACTHTLDPLPQNNRPAPTTSRLVLCIEECIVAHALSTSPSW